jgi:hypothetical protein
MKPPESSDQLTSLSSCSFSPFKDEYPLFTISALLVQLLELIGELLGKLAEVLVQQASSSWQN